MFTRDHTRIVSSSSPTQMTSFTSKLWKRVINEWSWLAWFKSDQGIKVQNFINQACCFRGKWLIEPDSLPLFYEDSAWRELWVEVVHDCWLEIYANEAQTCLSATGSLLANSRPQTGSDLVIYKPNCQSVTVPFSWMTRSWTSEGARNLDQDQVAFSSKKIWIFISYIKDPDWKGSVARMHTRLFKQD
jgi:hypothetical protein